MENERNDYEPSDPIGRDKDTREQIKAVAGLIEAFIAHLMLLVPSRYKADIQEALDKMKEVVDGNIDSR